MTHPPRQLARLARFFGGREVYAMTLLSNQEVEDAQIAHLDQLAKYGDPDAGAMLHALLSMKLGDAMYGRALSMPVVKLLHDMHAAIARGESAEESMHLSKPQSAPPLMLKRERMVSLVADMMAHGEGIGLGLPRKPLSNTQKAEVYRLAANAFGVAKSTVKNAYLAELKRLAAPH
ncbi:MAG: hypothetical protein ABIQ36_04570 [Rhodanobacter sp.]